MLEPVRRDLQRVAEAGGAVHGVGVDLGDHVLAHEPDGLEVLLVGGHAHAERELVRAGRPGSGARSRKAGDDASLRPAAALTA